VLAIETNPNPRMTEARTPSPPTQGDPTAAPGPHPLDAATHLAEDGEAGLAGRTHAAYANMVGPFGGVIASTLLNGALVSAQRLGDPVALTVNYAGPIADGAFRLHAQPMRTNRSTQHWSMRLEQGGQVCATATAVFATRRDTWTSTEIGFPAPPPPDAIEPIPPLEFAAWTRRYEMRFVLGGAPDFSGPDRETHSICSLWIRDEPPRPLDFLSLAAICDAFFPRIFQRRPRWTPAGTVSLTTYFHADAGTLAAQGAHPVFGAARAQHFGRGYFDQTAEVWGRDGSLLATSHQIVYYKE
jgi:acyl-coenzyme A thioesterase PaaI-like protein